MRSVHCPDAPHSITISVEKHAGVHVSVGVDVEILLASGHAWEWIPPERYGFAARWLLLIVGSAGSAAAFGGLIQSRLSDYRWRALYIMGLTVLIECAIVMALLTRMDPNGAYGWVPYAVRFSITGILGLMLTGVSLC